MTEKMTARQRTFVEAYSGNATEAAIKAGYSRRSAYSIGNDNLKKPEIKKAIQEREKKRNTPLIANREERQQFWTGVMRDPNADMSDRIAASKLLGQSEGDFLDRVEMDVAVTPASILAEVRRRREAALGRGANA